MNNGASRSGVYRSRRFNLDSYVIEDEIILLGIF